MNDRWVALVLVLVSFVALAGAGWLALAPAEVQGTRCGPVVVQRNADEAVCDDYYASRQLATPVLLGVAAVAYAASSLIERRADRRVERAEAQQEA